MRKKWTEDEEIYLEYYVFSNDELDYNEAAKFLKRTPSSIRGKMFKLRQRKNQKDFLRRPFSQAEKDFIKENYGHMSMKAIAKRLGRSPEVVSYKACQFGLQKLSQLEYYDEELRRLAREGYTVPEIRDLTGLKYSSIRYYLIRNDIDFTRSARHKQQPIKFGK